MTDEEIREETELLAAMLAVVQKTVEESQLSYRERVHIAAESAVRAVARKARAEALAEAIPLACGHCLNNRPVERRGEDWYHPAHGYWPESRCDAGAVRALAAREGF